MLRTAAVSGVLVAVMTGLVFTAVGQARRASRVSRAEAAQRRLAQEGQRQLRRTLYATQTNLAQQELAAGNRPRAIDLLLAQRPGPDEEDLRGFEWRYLWRQAVQDDARWTLQPGQWLVKMVFFSPDGRSLFTGGWGGQVKQWDLRTRRGTRTFNGNSIAVLSPDGRRLATAAERGSAHLWDVATGRRLGSMPGHGQNFVGVAFAPGGRLLATSGAGKGNAVLLWEIRDAGKGVRRLAGFVPGSGPVGDLAFSPRGALLATASLDKRVRLWDVAHPAAVQLAGTLDGLGEYCSIAFSPDGRLLATGGFGTGTVALWDVATRRVVTALPGRWGARVVTAFSPDGRRLALGSDDGIVRIWSVGERRELAPLVGHRKGVTCVAFSPRASRFGRVRRTLASGSVDETVKLWDTAPRPPDRFQAHAANVFSMALSADGRTLVTGGADKTVRIWDLPTRRCRTIFRGPTEATVPTAVSPDGRFAAAGSDDRTVWVWDLATGKRIAFVQRHDANPFYTVGFSPDSRFLVYGDDGNVGRVWDVAARRVVRTLRGHTSSFGLPVFAPGGRLLATGSDPGDGHTRVWEFATGRQIKALPSRYGWAGPQDFSPDGKWLAAGSADFTIDIWEVGTWRAIETLRGNTDQMSWVGFSPRDGRTIATCCHDGTVRFWSTASWKETATLKDPNIADSALFTPDGNALLAGGIDGTIRIWRAGTLAEAEAELDRKAHEREATKAEQARDWPAAARHLGALLARCPDDLLLLHRRGNALAELGQWRAAAADFGKCLALGPKDRESWEQLSVAQWASGDLAGYRASCAGLLRLYRENLAADVAGAVARLAVRVPSAGIDPGLAVRLAEVQQKAEPKLDGPLLTLGAALYRAGRFEEAVRRLRAAIAAGRNGDDPQPSFYLAMAQARLGHVEEARRIVQDASRVGERLMPKPGDRRVRLDWADRFELQRLRQEAERVTGGLASR